MFRKTVVFFSLILSIAEVKNQIPNPNQYRFTLVNNGVVSERYAIDSEVGKMSRMWFSNTGDELFGGNQDIYVRNDERTYLFDFMSQPVQCIANRGGPIQEMNYWPNLVKSFGGETQPFTNLIFDSDCDGTCLTWLITSNSSYQHNYQYQTRLFVKKSEQKPIKLVTKTIDLDTGALVSVDTTRFSNWTTGPVPDYEFDYPMDLNHCFRP